MSLRKLIDIFFILDAIAYMQVLSVLGWLVFIIGCIAGLLLAPIPWWGQLMGWGLGIYFLGRNMAESLQ